MSSLRILTFNVYEFRNDPNVEKTLVVDWEKHIGDRGAPGYEVRLIEKHKDHDFADSETLFTILAPNGNGNAEEQEAVKAACDIHLKQREEYTRLMNETYPPKERKS